MPFNTFTVATAVTPSVIETYFSHYLNRGPLKQKPTAHISYHEGLRLIREFLDYSSRHTVEELQAFTTQWVPAPTWVRIQDCEIPPQFLKRAANVLRQQLGARGLEKIGGERWWTWRRPESPLHAEWVEMKKDYNERKRSGAKCDRVILYVHGGAYYFGSVDEHRYQMQRHARKLKARLLAPRYRLAPQFPFPCGLYDCIATYFYLLEHFEPNQVLFAGDSAGGGMVLSMLVTLRDQGCPLPAGTILLSPWVDLTHSFPSTSGDGSGDYIPAHGFLHKPSMAWPPPFAENAPVKKAERKFTQPMEQPFEVVELPAIVDPDIVRKPSTDNLRTEARQQVKVDTVPLTQVPGFADKLAIEIDGKVVEIRDQIQLYARNELLTHPLVSPVQQPSLGGLPPMLIQVGGAELLRDEQIYLAHKAANPRDFAPSDAIMNEYDPHRTIINQYPPTNVQLQVWEDLCHVPHTLSFTRPAKYMYRSVAQFGAWALAHAQHKGIEIRDDDAVSVISNKTDPESFESPELTKRVTNGSIGIEGVSSNQFKLTSTGAVGKAGDQLPPFVNYMIRERVDRHGIIYPLPLPSEIASLHLDPSTIGAIKPGPVRKWLTKKAEHDLKFANEYKKIQKKRAKEVALGYDPFEEGELPPPSALFNRRRRGVAPEEKKKGKSWGLALWSGWGSHHDENSLEREEKILAEDHKEDTDHQRSGSVAESVATTDTARPQTAVGGSQKSSLTLPATGDTSTNQNVQRRTSSSSRLSARVAGKDGAISRARSPYRKITDAGQASGASSPAVESPLHGGGTLRAAPWGTEDMSRKSSRSNLGKAPSIAHGQPPMAPVTSVPTMSDTGKTATKVAGSENTYLNADSSRPHNGTVAYPFKLRPGTAGGISPNPSTMTLDSFAQSDRETPGQEKSGIGAVSISAPGERIDSLADGGRTTPQEVSPVSPAVVSSSLRSGVINSRDSRLGNLGPDGMPTAAFPFTSPHHATNSIEDPVSPVDDDNNSKSTPFKVRNPVYDARAGSQTSLSQQPMTETGGSVESAKSAPPFKLRHTIYDPKIAPPGSRAPGEDAVPMPAEHAVPGALDEASRRREDGPTNDVARANANTPAAISIRMPPPLSDAGSVPPTPPPKDDEVVSSTNPKRNGMAVLPTLPTEPLGDSAAPSLGNLSFERSNDEGGAQRPPLETFVTASEGLDLKSFEFKD